jgi:hypothetical protein
VAVDVNYYFEKRKKKFSKIFRQNFLLIYFLNNFVAKNFLIETKITNFKNEKLFSKNFSYCNFFLYI